MTDQNLEFKVAFSRIVFISWIIMISVAVIVTIFSLIFNLSAWLSWPLSYFLGAMVNLFAFNLLKNNISSLTSDAKSGITSSFSNYVIRLGIYGFILYIAFLNYNNDGLLNPYFVASGFITIRIAIYIYSFLKKKEG